FGRWTRRRGEGAETAARAPGDPVVAVSGLRKLYAGRGRLFARTPAAVRALDGVELQLSKGETLAIVGESGCGKSSLARVLAGLETASGGRVELAGHEVGSMRVQKRPAELKRMLQMVFQNPDSTLNPSHTVGYAIGRALRRLRELSRVEAVA